MPTLAALAARGEVGRAAVIPPGHAARAATSATCRSSATTRPSTTPAGRRSRRPPWACGCRRTGSPTAATSSTVGDDGTMVDFAGGHPSTEQAAAVIEALDAELGRGAGGEIEFHPGVQYRHILVAPGRLGRRRLHAAPRPLRQAGGVAHRSGRREAPGGDGRQPRHRRAASAWPPTRCGCGARASSRRCRASPTRDGLPGRRSSPPSTSSAASACSPTSTSVEVPGATGWFDTDYEGKRDAALRPWPTAPTCSSSTSRPPTRPATPATSRRR